jgi:hypothetical protein
MRHVEKMFLFGGPKTKLKKRRKEEKTSSQFPLHFEK